MIGPQPPFPGWLDPILAPPSAVNTVIFDVDGVLWDTAESYDSAVKATVSFWLERMGHGGAAAVSGAELRAFRRAGGLNNDWDLSFTLIATRLAGWEDAEAAAAASGGRGREWARELLPAGHSIDYAELVDIFNEYYWGAEDFERIFGRPPRFVPEAPGHWRQERQLLPDGLFEDLRRVGVAHFGIATGRTRTELAPVLAASQLGREVPADFVITGDVLAKPDGRVLQRIVEGMAASAAGPAPAALFCGDTRDDLDAVLNYRALGSGPAAWIGAVAVVPRDEWDFYRQAGCDAALENIAALPDLIEALNKRTDSATLEGTNP